MSELQSKTRQALLRVGTSTLTGVLNRRGLRSMFMQDVEPIRRDIPRMVGIAFTMRFIPSREDKDATGAPGRGNIQAQAMEACPPGHVLVVDSRGDARAASAGDLYVGRLKARGCAGIVTDGGLRDTEGVFKTGLPAYHRRASSPPSPAASPSRRSRRTSRSRTSPSTHPSFLSRASSSVVSVATSSFPARSRARKRRTPTRISWRLSGSRPRPPRRQG